MSEPVTKRRPMIDLEEFERRLGPPRATDPWEREPIAELSDLLGRREASDGADLKGRNQTAANVRLVSSSAVGRKELLPPEPFLRGDFAAIEAGLLGMGPRVEGPSTDVKKLLPSKNFAVGDFDSIEKAFGGAERADLALDDDIRAVRSDARGPELFGAKDFAAIEAELAGARREKIEASPIETFAADAFIGGRQEDADDANPLVASREPEGRNEQTRTRGPLYAMAAIIIAGLVATGVNLGLGRGPSETETSDIFDAASAPASASLEPTEAPANNLPTSNREQQPAPAGAVGDAAGQVDPKLAGEKAPRVIALTGESDDANHTVGAEVAVAPAAPEPVQPVAEASEAPAASAPDQVRTVAVRPDGALAPSDAQPQAADAPLAPQTPAPSASAKPHAPKPAAHAAKPASGTQTGSKGRPAQAAHSAKPKPVAAAKTTGPAQPVAAPTAQAPANDGAFGFMQPTVNSVTNGVSKMFGWMH